MPRENDAEVNVVDFQMLRRTLSIIWSLWWSILLILISRMTTSSRHSIATIHLVNYRIEKVITEGHYSVKPGNSGFYYFFTIFTG